MEASAGKKSPQIDKYRNEKNRRIPCFVTKTGKPGMDVDKCRVFCENSGCNPHKYEVIDKFRYVLYAESAVKIVDKKEKEENISTK